MHSLLQSSVLFMLDIETQKEAATKGYFHSTLIRLEDVSVPDYSKSNTIAHIIISSSQSLFTIEIVTSQVYHNINSVNLSAKSTHCAVLTFRSTALSILFWSHHESKFGRDIP